MLHARRSRRLVLVVEDDAGLRDSIRALLESLGFLVSTARNAREAICEVGAQRPDVILTDIYMPDGDGYELISAMRSFGEAIPIVAMSGGALQYGIEDHLGMAKRLGAEATLAKPFRAAALVELVDRAIAHRLHA
ncbi:response regulator [Dongia sp.]|uniref:response regulator n=1 Tax=Dongia sp. TaxID=1977262 RepID=UPI003750727C